MGISQFLQTSGIRKPPTKQVHNFESNLFPQLKLEKKMFFLAFCCVFLIVKAGAIISPLNSSENKKISKDNFT